MLIDLSSKLENQPKFIKIGEQSFQVRDDKNTVIKAFNLLKDSDKSEIEGIDEVLELLLGKQALKDISKLSLSISGYKVLFTGVMACVNGETYQETEKRFQKSR